MGLKKPSELFRERIDVAYQDYLRDPTSKFRADILASALNNQIEWTFKYYKQEGDKHKLRGATTLKEFRQTVFNDCPDLQLIWDLADAAKHRFLDRPSEPPRVVATSTAAYVVEGNDLRVGPDNRLFSEVASNAVRYWQNWQD